MRWIATSIAAMALFAGCSAEQERSQEPKRSASANASPRFLPLTGGRTPADLPERPALVVKIDNTRAARPQVGLGDADLVVEELAEGGLTRLAALYHSRLPDLIGPVRSIRTSDIGIVQPSGGVLVASGGAKVAIQALQRAGVALARFEAIGYSRDPSRRAPYNLMVTPEALLPEWSDREPPTDYLSWQRPGTTRPKVPATKVSAVIARFSPFHTTTWSHDATGWVRASDLSAQGDSFRPATLIVVRVETRDAGYRDPAGNRVPETVTTGSGDATVMTGDDAVTARWSKPAADKPWRFTTAGGAPVSIPPGRVWIELLPVQGGSLTVS